MHGEHVLRPGVDIGDEIAVEMADAGDALRFNQVALAVGQRRLRRLFAADAAQLPPRQADDQSHAGAGGQPEDQGRGRPRRQRIAPKRRGRDHHRIPRTGQERHQPFVAIGGALDAIDLAGRGGQPACEQSAIFIGAADVRRLRLIDQQRAVAFEQTDAGIARRQKAGEHLRQGIDLDGDAADADETAVGCAHLLGDRDRHAGVGGDRIGEENARPADVDVAVVLIERAVGQVRAQGRRTEFTVVTARDPVACDTVGTDEGHRMDERPIAGDGDEAVGQCTRRGSGGRALAVQAAHFGRGLVDNQFQGLQRGVAAGAKGLDQLGDIAPCGLHRSAVAMPDLITGDGDDHHHGDRRRDHRPLPGIGPDGILRAWILPAWILPAWMLKVRRRHSPFFPKFTFA